MIIHRRVQVRTAGHGGWYPITARRIIEIGPGARFVVGRFVPLVHVRQEIVGVLVAEDVFAPGAAWVGSVVGENGNGSRFCPKLGSTASLLDPIPVATSPLTFLPSSTNRH